MGDGPGFQEESHEGSPPRLHQPLPPRAFPPRSSRGRGSAEAKPWPSSCVLFSPHWCCLLTAWFPGLSREGGGSCMWVPGPFLLSLSECRRLSSGWTWFRPSRCTTAGVPFTQKAAWKELGGALVHRLVGGSPRAETPGPRGLCIHHEPRREQSLAAVKSLQGLASWLLGPKKLISLGKVYSTFKGISGEVNLCHHFWSCFSSVFEMALQGSPLDLPFLWRTPAHLSVFG